MIAAIGLASRHAQSAHGPSSEKTHARSPHRLHGPAIRRTREDMSRRCERDVETRPVSR